MNMASLLKKTSNVFMGATLVRLVVRDLGEELSRDAASVGNRANSLVRRSPYRALGAAAAMGLFAGMLLKRRH